jgi:hypothetical protein
VGTRGANILKVQPYCMSDSPFCWTELGGASANNMDAVVASVGWSNGEVFVGHAEGKCQPVLIRGIFPLTGVLEFVHQRRTEVTARIQ